MSDVFLNHFPLYLLRWGLSPNPEFAIRCRQQALGGYNLGCWDYRWALCQPGFFTWVLEISFQSSF